MSLDEEFLETVAQDGSMDYDKWPSQLEPLLDRLDQIIHNAFPIPKVPEPLASSFISPQSSFTSYPVQNSDSLQSSNKENAPPSDPPLYSSRLPDSLETTERVPDSQPSQTDSALAPQLLSLLNTIKSTLRTYFASKPPHTIQRLAELILRPTHQYRTLPAYLRAVDRVVAVSSSADIFPLPRTGMLGEGDLTNGIANGTGTSFMMADDSLGSDESLGGALLTPIPWISHIGLDPANTGLLGEGARSVRPDASVTQGELIRQEQEAGLILTTHPQNPSTTAATIEGDESGESRSSPQQDDMPPHARGPPIVGVEDLGLQDGRGVEMALSHPNVAQDGSSGSNGIEQNSATIRVNATTTTTIHDDADGDGDIILDDVLTGTKGADQEEDAGVKDGAAAEQSSIAPSTEEQASLSSSSEPTATTG